MITNRLLMIIVSTLFLLTAGPGMSAVDANAITGFDHSHSLWTTVLNRHVNNGVVDYRALSRNRDDMNTYIKEIGAVAILDYRSWTRPQKLAYWINAYNAFTMRVILDNYPIKSGRTLKGKFYPDNSIQQIPDVWDSARNRTVEGNVSLNHIEHEILRKQFHEPRIHFSIVCASIGCPKLWNQGFDATQLDQQLDAAAKRFVRNRSNVKLDLRDETIYFSWLRHIPAADRRHDRSRS